MPDQPSLLAQKLRDHRARQGRHGRMTQEELAEALGVSVDAIGKYERSRSYLRGDLVYDGSKVNAAPGSSPKNIDTR